MKKNTIFTYLIPLFLTLTACGGGGSDSAGTTGSNTAAPDITAPVITLIGESTVTVEVTNAYTDNGATASDNTDGDITSQIAVVNSVDTNTIGSYTVTYTTSDAAGNTASQVTRTVNVVDTTAPVITLIGEAIVTVEAGSDYVDAGATATDSFDGSLTPIVSSTIDTSTVGSSTITYYVYDAAGNEAESASRTVHVVDTTSPIITLIGDSEIIVETGADYIDLGASAIDYINGDIATNIVTVNLVDSNTIGSYFVTYNVSDAAGNAAIQLIRTVNIVEPVDTTAPVITMLAQSPAHVEQGAMYTDAGATAFDDVDGDITENIIVGGTVDTSTLGVYSITYNVSDEIGNRSEQLTRVVLVDEPRDYVDDFSTIIKEEIDGGVRISGGFYSYMTITMPQEAYFYTHGWTHLTISLFDESWNEPIDAFKTYTYTEDFLAEGDYIMPIVNSRDNYGTYMRGVSFALEKNYPPSNQALANGTYSSEDSYSLDLSSETNFSFMRYGVDFRIYDLETRLVAHSSYTPHEGYSGLTEKVGGYMTMFGVRNITLPAGKYYFFTRGGRLDVFSNKLGEADVIAITEPSVKLLIEGMYSFEMETRGAVRFQPNPYPIEPYSGMAEPAVIYIYDKDTNFIGSTPAGYIDLPKGEYYLRYVRNKEMERTYFGFEYP
jgi:hypothetical protein